MRRYFFDLRGGQHTRDQHGLQFKTELAASRAGTKLAKELAETRPQLRGNTYVVVRRSELDDGYYISV